MAFSLSCGACWVAKYNSIECTLLFVKFLFLSSNVSLPAGLIEAEDRCQGGRFSCIAPSVCTPLALLKSAFGIFMCSTSLECPHRWQQHRVSADNQNSLS